MKFLMEERLNVSFLTVIHSCIRIFINIQIVRFEFKYFSLLLLKKTLLDIFPPQRKSINHKYIFLNI